VSGIILEMIQGHGRRWLMGFTQNPIPLPIVRLEDNTAGFTKLVIHLYSFFLLWKFNIIKISNTNNNLVWLY